MLEFCVSVSLLAAVCSCRVSSCYGLVLWGREGRKKVGERSRLLSNNGNGFQRQLVLEGSDKHRARPSCILPHLTGLLGSFCVSVTSGPTFPLILAASLHCTIDSLFPLSLCCWLVLQISFSLVRVPGLYRAQYCERSGAGG